MVKYTWQADLQMQLHGVAKYVTGYLVVYYRTDPAGGQASRLHK